MVVVMVACKPLFNNFNLYKSTRESGCCLCQLGPSMFPVSLLLAITRLISLRLKSKIYLPFPCNRSTRFQGNGEVLGSGKVRIGVIIYSIARRQEDPEFKVMLSYVASSRPTWSAGDPGPKPKTTNKQPALIRTAVENGQEIRDIKLVVF